MFKDHYQARKRNWKSSKKSALDHKIAFRTFSAGAGKSDSKYMRNYTESLLLENTSIESKLIKYLSRYAMRFSRKFWSLNNMSKALSNSKSKIIISILQKKGFF